MEQIISFSLGNIWRWCESPDRSKLIRYLKRLDVSGVEIVFPTEKELYAFKLSGIDAEWLRGLSYTTIHAPFNLFSTHSDEETILKQLIAISKLYERIHAKSVVFHPGPLKKLAAVADGNFHATIENLPPGRHGGIPELIRIFNEYPKFSFCLDISHAYLWSKDETARLIRKFGSRLSQIHLSGTFRRKTHQPLQRVSRNFRQTLEEIKGIDVPLVIEEDFREKSIADVKKELTFIRELFHIPCPVTA